MCPELSDMRIVSVSEHYKSTLVEQELLTLRSTWVNRRFLVEFMLLDL